MGEESVNTLALPLYVTVTLQSAGFHGNRAALPSESCVACGMAMSWRRRWAKNRADVEFCSETCRRKRGNEVPSW